MSSTVTASSDWMIPPWLDAGSFNRARRNLQVVLSQRAQRSEFRDRVGIDRDIPSHLQDDFDLGLIFLPGTDLFHHACLEPAEAHGGAGVETGREREVGFILDLFSRQLLVGNPDEGVNKDDERDNNKPSDLRFATHVLV